MAESHKDVSHKEIDWARTKITRKPCPICNVDIIEYNAMKKEIAELKKKLKVLPNVSC